MNKREGDDLVRQFLALLDDSETEEERVEKVWELINGVTLGAWKPHTAYQAMEAALQVLAGNINSLRTELLVIKVEIMKESPGEP